MSDSLTQAAPPVEEAPAPAPAEAPAPAPAPAEEAPAPAEAPAPTHEELIIKDIICANNSINGQVEAFVANMKHLFSNCILANTNVCNMVSSDDGSVLEASLENARNETDCLIHDLISILEKTTVSSDLARDVIRMRKRVN